MKSRSFTSLMTRCVAASLLATSAPLSQEVPAADNAAQRVATQDARADGRRAAEQRSVGGRLLGGALAGVPLGFFGSLAHLAGPQPEIVATAAVGGGALLLARRPGDTAAPGPLAALAAREGSAYEQAWRAGYRERLGERRRKAANVGGMVGAIIGVALMAANFLDGDYT